MTAQLFSAVLIVVAIGYWAARVHRFLTSNWLVKVSWRWISGGEPGRQQRGRRAGRRCGTVAVAVTVMAFWLRFPQVMTKVILAGLVTGVLAVCWQGWLLVRRWKHHRTWLWPVHQAACAVAQIDPRRSPRSWLEIEPDRSRVVAALPGGWPADDKDKQRLVAILSAKVGLESPEASWRLAGPKPQLELTASRPPPLRVSLADIKPALDAARPDELVWGLGKRSAVVSSSLSADSPHLGLSMGSGAGKSVTARALLAQMLYRGCIGLVLDYKMISHQWAQGLPNVAIARRPHEIHAALLWLGAEVERRNEVALAGADIEGNVHAVVGPRLIVVCEELNATVARLRAHWRQERDREDPVRSPALEALDAVSFMGRQVLTNMIYIGQRLSVKASGGDGDARENIGVVAFGRYSASNWKMLAGDHPMPPKSLAPGRIQVVGSSVRETQGAFMSPKEARALATAGEVGVPPSGMPFVRHVPPGTAAQIPGPEQPVSQRPVPSLGHPPGLVTLSEAVQDGIVSCSLHAVRKATQRDPEFPGGKGVQGLAKLYDPMELASWNAERS